MNTGIPGEITYDQILLDIERNQLNIREARDAILNYFKSTGEKHGHINCPVCEIGKLRFQVFRNGNVAGSCSHKPCVMWMESSNQSPQ